MTDRATLLTLYRGVFVADDHDLPDACALAAVDLTRLGRHWSSDPDVARAYALDVMRRPGGTGVVLTATVAADAIETDRAARQAAFVMSPGHYEREVFLRADALVQVTCMSVVRGIPEHLWPTAEEPVTATTSVPVRLTAAVDSARLAR